MASNTVPRKLHSRLRKHLTPAAAIQAKKESNQQQYLQQCQPQEPADFITYKPQLHADVPTETPPKISLRTSVDVLIPQENRTRPYNNPQTPRSNHALPAEPHTTNKSAEIARQIRQIQADEQESNIEQDKHKAAISQQLDKIDTRTAEILLGMRFGRRTEDTSIGNITESTNRKEVLGTLQGQSIESSKAAGKED
ncbi:hypothetical protein K469DRAFT_683798 [Zopfia rhizophila CBS 207.26]|uniref:Uncharacterized protein n=1 Tax=Zopfia rhizophila CBS 207.26 TaxID=1314779 RepID=A0A6A6EC27_9PEZI|nr:hypothetical protein K469DRAFT_683798 [Zopfia rhizophila CBS 207.26]